MGYKRYVYYLTWGSGSLFEFRDVVVHSKGVVKELSPEETWRAGSAYHCRQGVILDEGGFLIIESYDYVEGEPSRRRMKLVLTPEVPKEEERRLLRITEHLAISKGISPHNVSVERPWGPQTN